MCHGTVYIYRFVIFFACPAILKTWTSWGVPPLGISMFPSTLSGQTTLVGQVSLRLEDWAGFAPIGWPGTPRTAWGVPPGRAWPGWSGPGPGTGPLHAKKNRFLGYRLRKPDPFWGLGWSMAERWAFLAPFGGFGEKRTRLTFFGLFSCIKY